MLQTTTSTDSSGVEPLFDYRHCKKCGTTTSHRRDTISRKLECLRCDGGRPATQTCDRCGKPHRGERDEACYKYCQIHGWYVRPSWKAGCPVCADAAFTRWQVCNKAAKGINWSVAGVWGAILGFIFFYPWTIHLIPKSVLVGFDRWFPYAVHYGVGMLVGLIVLAVLYRS